MDINEYHIRYINLDSRPDRRVHAEYQFKKAGIPAERFSAFSIKDIKGNVSHENIVRMKKYGNKQGNIGCYYSHLAVLQEALSAKKNALIFEDDVIICSDFLERLAYIEIFLKDTEWDMFFLGATVHVNPPYWHKKGHNKDIVCDCTIGKDIERTSDKRIMRSYGFFSTTAYMVNVNSIQRIMNIMDEYVHLSWAIDHLYIMLQPKLFCYLFVPGCTIQMDGRSDIGNGMSRFSNFSRLGKHWFADKMNDFDPDKYNW